MLLLEKEYQIPSAHAPLIPYFHQWIDGVTKKNSIPVRFTVTATDRDAYHCELGVLTDAPDWAIERDESIFTFRKRRYENRNTFNAVMIVPTGVGAEIGGHAGDACPTARLLASVCDTLVTHPNVVNASDINEMPSNGVYVEGSVLSDLLMGTCGLMPSRANRVILLIDKHRDPRISASTINAISAARATLGLDCPMVVEIDPPIVMRGGYANSGRAVGRVEGFERVCDVLEKYQGQYDAIAVSSVIKIRPEHRVEYFEKDGEAVNPWGGVEAILTHAITKLYGLPAAHSPMFESRDVANVEFELGVVDPRMSAEMVSTCFLHCILKGLHDSPRVIRDASVFHSPGVIAAENIACLVIPDGCVGLPTLAAMEQGIPVIAVRENQNRMRNRLSDYAFESRNLITVDNYLEAAGVMAALRAGVCLDSVRRPLRGTLVRRETTIDSAAAAPQEDGQEELVEQCE